MDQTTLSGATIVQEKFGLSDGRRFVPGQIAIAADDNLAGRLEQYGTDLEGFWGAPFEAVPQRGKDGKLYPQLMQRPATAELYVRIEPYTIRLLKDCARVEQIDAVRRCRDSALLSLVARGLYGLATATLARQLLGDGIENADQPLAIERASTPGGGMTPVVVTAAGQELSTTEYWATELEPLIRQQRDLAFLDLIEKHDGRPPLKELLDARRDALLNWEPEPAPDAFGRDDEVGLTRLGWTDDDKVGVISGEHVSPAGEYTVDDLAPLIAACEDTELLGTLASGDERKGVIEAIGKRLGDLQGLRIDSAGELVATFETDTRAASEFSIADLTELIAAESRPEILAALAADTRKGIQQLAAERLALLSDGGSG